MPPPSQSLSNRNRNSTEILLNTINQTDHQKIRETLRKICLQFPEARDIAAGDLLAIFNSKNNGYSADRYDTLTENAVAIIFDGGKLGEVIPRFEECRNCGKTYDVVENREGARKCFWHDGMYSV